MSDGAIPLTAIVLTQDEAVNIERCLTAMQRVDEIIIVDSGSRDSTLEIARRVRPDVRAFTHPFRDFGDQRNWALDHTAPKNDWILFVDADEYCTPELLDEIAAFLAEPGRFIGAYVAGRNYFLGRWLKHATMYPSYQLRLLRRGRASYAKHGHGQREILEGPADYLIHGWIHDTFSKGVEEWIARHNRYSSEEVDLLSTLKTEKLSWPRLHSRDSRVRGRALKQLSAKLPLRPLWTFLYMYVARRGFLDGWAGFLYCALMTAHHIHIEAKIAEARYAESSDCKPRGMEIHQDSAADVPVEQRLRI